MDTYSTSVFLHVLAAILGLGPLGALAVASSSRTSFMPAERFAQLLRGVGWGLVAMLATGAVILRQTHGAFGHAAWLRASFGLFVILGALYVVARRRVKRGPNAGPSLGPRGLSPLLWAMCVIVAAITYLMEAKPW